MRMMNSGRADNGTFVEHDHNLNISPHSYTVAYALVAHSQFGSIGA